MIVKASISGAVMATLAMATSAPTMQPTDWSPQIPGRYCATFNPDHADGIAGHFGLQLHNNTAHYWFHLDFSNSSSTTCDFASGLDYHIHSTWTASTHSGSGSATCNGAGGHYDPDLACGSASQEYSGLCAAIGRAAAPYNCTPEMYSTGHYYNCEVGDLSGKHGQIHPVSGRVFTTGTDSPPYVDLTPPYLYNYKTVQLFSHAWSSVVFHCGSERIACASFLPARESSACAMMPSIPVPFDPEFLTEDQKNVIRNNNNTAIALCVLAVAGVAFIYIVLYIQYQNEKKEEARMRELRDIAGVVGELGGASEKA